MKKIIEYSFPEEQSEQPSHIKPPGRYLTCSKDHMKFELLLKIRFPSTVNFIYLIVRQSHFLQQLLRSSLFIVTERRKEIHQPGRTFSRSAIVAGSTARKESSKLKNLPSLKKLRYQQTKSVNEFIKRPPCRISRTANSDGLKDTLKLQVARSLSISTTIPRGVNMANYATNKKVLTTFTC